MEQQACVRAAAAAAVLCELEKCAIERDWRSSVRNVSWSLLSRAAAAAAVGQTNRAVLLLVV